jgi:hypothetical protein
MTVKGRSFYAQTATYVEDVHRTPRLIFFTRCRVLPNTISQEEDRYWLAGRTVLPI